jgi:hypothetical protein
MFRKSVIVWVLSCLSYGCASPFAGDGGDEAAKTGQAVHFGRGGAKDGVRLAFFGSSAGRGQENAGAAGEAVDLMRQAMQADRAGRLDECIVLDRAALAIEETARARFHLASCESRNALLNDALRDAQRALDIGIEQGDVGLIQIAPAKVRELRERMPYLTVVAPRDAHDLSVTMDGQPVPIKPLGARVSVDPGKHRLVAEGSVHGRHATFAEEYDVHEREDVAVRVSLSP